MYLLFSSEFFHLLSLEMTNPDYALFECIRDTGLYKPNSNSSVNSNHLFFFEFFGKILAKVIIDSESIYMQYVYLSLIMSQDQRGWHDSISCIRTYFWSNMRFSLDTWRHILGNSHITQDVTSINKKTCIEPDVPMMSHYKWTYIVSFPQLEQVLSWFFEYWWLLKEPLRKEKWTMWLMNRRTKSRWIKWRIKDPFENKKKCALGLLFFSISLACAMWWSQPVAALVAHDHLIICRCFSCLIPPFSTFSHPSSLLL